MRPPAHLFCCLLLVAVASARGQEAEEVDLLFLGYETEPGMDFGGRTVVSVQSGITRAIEHLGGVGPLGAAEAAEHALRQHLVGLGAAGVVLGTFAPSLGLGWRL